MSEKKANAYEVVINTSINVVTDGTTVTKDKTEVLYVKADAPIRMVFDAVADQVFPGGSTLEKEVSSYLEVITGEPAQASFDIEKIHPAT